MRVNRIVSFVVAVIVLPATVFAQKTTYDYDKTASFAQFKTYAMKDGTPTGNPLIDNRIVASIEAQLAAKGLVRNDAMPDVFVLYHVAFDEQKDISTYSSGPIYGGYGLGLGWRVGSHDDGRACAGNPRRESRHRHGRCSERTDGVARPRHQGDRHQCEAAQA
jgi:hypothetical protein